MCIHKSDKCNDSPDDDRLWPLKGLLLHALVIKRFKKRTFLTISINIKVSAEKNKFLSLEKNEEIYILNVKL